MAFHLWENMQTNADDEIATEARWITPTGDVVLTGNALNLQAGYLFKSNYEMLVVLLHRL